MNPSDPHVNTHFFTGPPPKYQTRHSESATCPRCVARRVLAPCSSPSWPHGTSFQYTRLTMPHACCPPHQPRTSGQHTHQVVEKCRVSSLSSFVKDVAEICKLFMQDTANVFAHSTAVVVAPSFLSILRHLVVAGCPNPRCACRPARLTASEVDAGSMFDRISWSASSLNSKRSTVMRPSSTSARLESAPP